MENESKRKNIVTIAIGVFIMLVLVVGSTYAFFQLTSDETGNSASSFTGELDDIENYGNSFLRGGLTGYHIKVNASDMAPSKIGTHYYGTTDENSDYNLKRMNYEVSEVSIEGGENNDNVEYTCTSELSITLDGSLTEGDVLQEGDGALYLSGSNIRLDQRKIDLKELIEEASKSETNEYKKTLTYIISKGNNGTLNVDFEIVNRNAIQNDIAGKKIGITIKNSNLQCEVSGKKVYASLDNGQTYNSSAGLLCGTKYRSSAYIKKIVSASFVNYIPNDSELETKTYYWDLSDTTSGTPAKSVIGWLEETEEGTDQYNLYIGSKDKIYVKDLSNTFLHMINLKEINFGNLNTSETTNMNYMFMGYKETTLDLSTFDTSKVTSMKYMFMDSKLLTLDLSSFNTSKVTDMSGMFHNTSVELPFEDWPNFVTSSVKDMDQIFSSYKGNNLDLSTFDTTQVTDMSDMFREVAADLPFQEWPNFVTSNVENMGSMFYGYKGSTLDLSTFDTSKVTDMRSMFSNCNNLTTLDLSSFTFAQVTTEGGTLAGNYATFYNVPSSCQVKIKPSQEAMFKSKFPLGTSWGDRQFKLPNED